jgi:hypothetical protein
MPKKPDDPASLQMIRESFRTWRNILRRNGTPAEKHAGSMAIANLKQAVEKGFRCNLFFNNRLMDLEHHFPSPKRCFGSFSTAC